MKRTFSSILLLALSALALGGCQKSSPHNPTHTSRGVNLTFLVKSRPPAPAQEAGLRAVTEEIKEDSNHSSFTTNSTDVGEEIEYYIKDLWICLFKKGAPGSSDDSAPLEYAWHYTNTGGRNPATDLIAPKNQTPVRSYDDYYQTPTKRVAAGKYILAVYSNTDYFANESDVKSFHAGATPSAPRKGMTYGQFKGIFLNPVGRIAYPATPRDFSRRGPGEPPVGLQAYALQEIEVLATHYNYDRPLQVAVDMKRTMAKLRVFISNVEEDGTLVERSKGYEVEQFGVVGMSHQYYFPEFSTTEEKRTYLHAPFDVKSQPFYYRGFLRPGHPNAGSSDNYTSRVRIQDQYPFVKFLWTGAPFNDKIQDRLLYETYLAPHDDGSSQWLEETIPLVSPNYKTYHRSTEFIFTVKKGENRIIYTIPLYEQASASVPKDHRIKPNTVYELHITMKGPELLKAKIGYQEVPWNCPPESHIPSFD